VQIEVGARFGITEIYQPGNGGYRIGDDVAIGAQQLGCYGGLILRPCM
jgi:hypothetical protein